MLKKIFFVLFSILIMTNVSADVFKKEDLTKLSKEKAGGEGAIGVLVGEYAFTRDKALANEAVKEIAWLTLAPGDAVGFHKHVTNEDVYIIVSGKGEFTDKDGSKIQVKPGDITIARVGTAHAIANTGKEPLVFISVIAEQTKDK